MAGMEGFEPPNASTKNWCLTTWRHPINKSSPLYLKNRLKTTLIRYNKHMRVIEPHQLRKQKTSKTKKPLLIIVGLILIAAFTTSHIRGNSHADSSLNVLGLQTIQDSRANAAQKQDYRYFAPPEFQQLYSKFVYPNTQMMMMPPKITGNAAADIRIRTIASSRGFVLQPVPISAIMKVDETSSDNLLQEKALVGWRNLRVAAHKENIPLNISIAYRSIEQQRQVFLQNLQASDVTTPQIINGQADRQISAILLSTAIPGYSHHQTGYTVDMSCGDTGLSFEDTPCYTWISKDNYRKAKESGWIPSYPEGAASYSPEPEYAEYIWVGTQALLKE